MSVLREFSDENIFGIYERISVLVCAFFVIFCVLQPVMLMSVFSMGLKVLKLLMVKLFILFFIVGLRAMI